MPTTTMERMNLSSVAGTNSVWALLRAGARADRPGAWVRDAWTFIREQTRAKRDMRRLEQLDDRMLRDIGITRSEIASAIYGLPRGERRCHDQP